MLLETAAYGGVYAKIKALEKNLLKYQDYVNLASQKDVKSFANMLFDDNYLVEYTSVLKKSVDIGRISMERSIASTMYQNFMGIYSFLTDENVKKYLNTFNLKYKVGFIKSLLRSLYDERVDEVSIPKKAVYSKSHQNLSFEQLSYVKTFSELLDALEHTEFHKVLAKLEGKNPSLYELETQLDFYTYNEIWKSQNKNLSKKDLNAQMAINGMDIDIHNIMYIYRLKKYYNIDKDRIYTNLIPINYRLKQNKLEDLIDAVSEEDFLDYVRKTCYKDVFDGYFMNDPELSYYKFMYKIHLDAERKDPFSLQKVTAYFYKKGQEVRNLITLIECVRYGLRPEESLKKLNLLIKRGENTNG